MRACLLLSISITALWVAACGGSSSETPPPLQPDPSGFRYASPPIARAQDSDAGLSSITNDPDPESDPQPATAAPTSGEPGR